MCFSISFVFLSSGLCGLEVFPEELFDIFGSPSDQGSRRDRSGERLTDAAAPVDRSARDAENSAKLARVDQVHCVVHVTPPFDSLLRRLVRLIFRRFVRLLSVYRHGDRHR